MVFESILPPSPHHRRRQGPGPSQVAFLLKLLGSNFRPSTLLLVGAVLQAILVLLIPTWYALTPAVGLLLLRLADTIAITAGVKANPYMKNVVLKKTSAQVPDQYGEFSADAAAEDVVIFLLCAKYNHPLGVLCPGAAEIGGYVQRMSEEIETSSASNGFLGSSGWSMVDEHGAQELMLLQYWRSIEAIHEYAHGPLHREAWEWWQKTLKQHDYIGINHELYHAQPGQWENLYVNFQPTLLGATTYLKRGDKLEGGAVPDQWISPLVQANKGQLRTSAGRLNQGPPTQHDKYGPNIYE